ncbi:alkylation response protein AidB-like acyl-CoA dehydrogenase [Paraburkholderia youngii]
MKLEFSAEDQAFRSEVREFVKNNLSPRLKRKAELGLRIERDDYVEWYTLLYEKGWIAPSWKKEHGGPGWTHVQRYIFDEETLLGGAPRIVASGINMLGPVLNEFGHTRAKSEVHPEDPAQRNLVGAGLLGAGRGLGPRGGAHHGRACHGR